MIRWLPQRRDARVVALCAAVVLLLSQMRPQTTQCRLGLKKE
jgi:hypothetical protein